MSTWCRASELVLDERLDDPNGNGVEQLTAEWLSDSGTSSGMNWAVAGGVGTDRAANESGLRAVHCLSRAGPPAGAQGGDHSVIGLPHDHAVADVRNAS